MKTPGRPKLLLTLLMCVLLFANHGVVLDRSVDRANQAATYGDLKTLKELAAQTPPVFPATEGANWAAGRRQLPVLEWLAAQSPPILPTAEGADLAARREFLDVLEWLAKQNPPILPTAKSAREAEAKNEPQ